MSTLIIYTFVCQNIFKFSVGFALKYRSEHMYIYTFFSAGSRSAVGRAPDSKVRGLGFDTGLATYFRFSLRRFKRGSCQLLAKVCARNTG